MCIVAIGVAASAGILAFGYAIEGVVDARVRCVVGAKSKTDIMSVDVVVTVTLVMLCASTGVAA